jgi:hypothetical protein
MHGLRRFFVKLFGYKRKDEVWLFEEISHRFKNDGKLVFAGELHTNDIPTIKH